MKKICVIAICFLLLTIIFVGSGGADDQSNITISVNQYGPRWDINQDGIADALDVSSLVSHYGNAGPLGWIHDDINQDGKVNGLDVSGLVSHYGDTWIS